jgi:hypothetical protein
MFQAGHSKTAWALPKMTWDETYWLQRADQARAIGDSMRNHECRMIMEEMAESYERLAGLTKRFQKKAGQGLDGQSPAPTNSNIAALGLPRGRSWSI